jgi:choline dehydrogenase-like flavoprotein
MISMRYDSDAVANMTAARERLREIFARAGLKLAVAVPRHDGRPGSSVHWGGTVRMHDQPEFGVLDGWNRIYDVPNVVVCDSSCFTTGPEKNPTLTAMAIAARAADRLAGELT